jgi:hypothetical protein
MHQYLARLGKVQSNKLCHFCHYLINSIVVAGHTSIIACVLLASHLTDTSVVQHFLSDGSLGVI